jgi:hypothetical protein
MFVSSNLLSQPDTVMFSSDKVGLSILTQNPDSIKYFPERDIPNPFSPSMTNYSVKISIYDSSKLIIKFKDANEETLVVYIWNKVSPGAYIFHWWEYQGIQRLSGGIYFTEKIINDKSETKKVVLVK